MHIPSRMCMQLHISGYMGRILDAKLLSIKGSCSLIMWDGCGMVISMCMGEYSVQAKMPKGERITPSEGDDQNDRTASASRLDASSCQTAQNT